MTKTSPGIDKYDTHKNDALHMRHILRKKGQRLPYLARTELSDF